MHGSWFDGAHRWGIVLTSGLLLTGCGIASPTNPPPHGPPLPLQPAPAARPFEIPLQDASSCTVLSRAQRARLGFDKDPLPASYDVSGDEHPCSYRDGRTKQSARIGLITTQGARTPTETAPLRAVPVGEAGFPAVVVKNPELNHSCDVEVDVARGQHLDVLYTQYGRGTPPPQDDLCRNGQRVAENAVTTLTHPGSASQVPAATDSDDPRTGPVKSEAVSPRLQGHR